MDEMLTAAQEGDIDKLYDIIQKEPYILDMIDDVPFIDTPLHVAAYHGMIPFATEIMRLKPSFALKLNQAGFSPMHLALHNGKTEMVLRFLNCKRDLVRVQGREGKTPLHHVVEQEDLHLLTQFLLACPSSIQDVTIHSETALHIALKNEKLQAFEFLIGGLQRACYKGSHIQEKVIINWKNEKGETALHIATAKNQPQVVRLLIECGIDVNSKNSGGLTALDMLGQHNNTEVKEILLHAKAKRGDPQVSYSIDYHLASKIPFIKRRVIYLIRLKKNINADTLSLLLVVAALILTSTYQSGLSPPGGVWQDDKPNNITRASTSTNGAAPIDNDQGSSEAVRKAGTIVMPHKAFMFFFTINSLTLLTTTLVIFFLLPSGQMNFLLVLPLYLFSLCYMISWKTISPHLSHYVFVIWLLLYSLAFIWLCVHDTCMGLSACCRSCFI